MNLALKKKRLPLGNLLPQFPGIWFPYLKHGDNDYSYKIFKVPQQKPRTLVRARDGRPWRKMTGEGMQDCGVSPPARAPHQHHCPGWPPNSTCSHRREHPPHTTPHLTSPRLASPHRRLLPVAAAHLPRPQVCARAAYASPAYLKRAFWSFSVQFGHRRWREGRREGAGKRVGVSERAPPVRRGFLAARGAGGVAAAVAPAAKMAEGLERVRISASELRGILATLAPQAGSRGESHRPAPGLGLPAPPPSPPPPPPPSPARCASEPPPLPPTVGAGTRGRRRVLGRVRGPALPALAPSGTAQPEFQPPSSFSPRKVTVS